MNHAVRIWADLDEQDFWIEFLLAKYPGKQVQTVYKLTDSKFKKKYKEIMHYVRRFISYLTNIKWAILGRPSWYTADAMWTEEQAKQIIEFLTQTLKEMKPKCSKKKLVKTKD
jgi:hypothetical protein